MVDRPNIVLAAAVVSALVCLAFVIAFGPTRTARSQSGDEFVFETIGSLAGSYSAVAHADGGYLLLGGPGEVSVVDAREPAVPHIAGTLGGVTGTVQDIAVEGGKAYVGASAAGLLIMDIADPAAPSLLGQYVPEPISGVAVHEGLAVIAGNDRVYVVDVSDPAHPRELSRVEASVVQPTLPGDYALLGGTNPVLSVLGISDPEQTDDLGRWEPRPGGWGSDVVVDAETDLAYVGRNVPYMLLIPTPGPTFTPGGPPVTASPAATRPSSEGYLHIVRVSTPSAPEEAGRRSFCCDVYVSALALDPVLARAYVGVRFYNSREPGSLYALDVSDVNRVGHLARIDLQVDDVAFADGLLHVAAEDGGLRIIRPAAAGDHTPTPNRPVAYAPLVLRIASGDGIPTPVGLAPTPTPTWPPTRTGRKVHPFY